MRTRSRTISGLQTTGKFTSYKVVNGKRIQILGSSSRDLNIPGIQITESEGHPFRRNQSSGLEDLGGPFKSTRKYVEGDFPPRLGTTQSQMFQGPPQFYIEDEYRGPIMPVDATITVAGKKTLNFPPAGNSSNTKLDELGATAVSRCSPTNSPADASVFLGELLRDGLPSMVGSSTWKSRTLTAKNAGSEYLNVQFGWRPLADEVSRFRDFVEHSDAVLAQYERDAGKVVRRRYEFPIIRKMEETNLGSSLPYVEPGGVPLYQSGGTVIRRRETLQRQWFSGAFTYHLPSGYDSRNEMSRLALKAKLLGLELTPDTVWNVAPWTWAIDWFSNAGDVVNNISDFATQGLVMRYGYIMEHTVVRDTYTMSKPVPYPGAVAPTTISPLVLVTETKIRRKANPFGFGVAWEGLSSFQASILAALGITRGRR
jgi:hypothetical protein